MCLSPKAPSPGICPLRPPCWATSVSGSPRLWQYTAAISSKRSSKKPVYQQVSFNSSQPSTRPPCARPSLHTGISQVCTLRDRLMFSNLSGKRLEIMSIGTEATLGSWERRVERISIWCTRAQMSKWQWWSLFVLLSSTKVSC